MNPFFIRVGSKRRIAKQIIRYIPDHKIYVEPFVGSGAIFFRKDKAITNILNDLDKNLIDGYELLKNTSSNSENYNTQSGTENIQNFVNNVSSDSSIEDRLLKLLYLSCNTFSGSGRGKIYGPQPQITKIKKIAEYVNKLKDTILTNEDYKIIIEKFDSPNTFFFLDPPYEESKKKNIYNHPHMDFEEFVNILTNITGKFLLTINDSPYIRRLFKDYVIVPIIVKPQGPSTIGNLDRNELIIMNYEL
jgi:DNA adenine methylase